MATDLSQLADYYADLLVLQYRSKPRARATIRLLAKQVLADFLADQVRQGFVVDTAVGEQLDIIGKYVGVPRVSGPATDKPYFGFNLYSETVGAFANEHGMTSYSSSSYNADAIWYRYSEEGTQQTALPDASYRVLIKLRIAANRSDHSLASIQSIMANLFPGQVFVQDNLDMTATYYVANSVQLDAATLAQFMPRPAGVSYTVARFDVWPTVKVVPAADYAYITEAVAFQMTSVSAPFSVDIVGDSEPYSYQWEIITESGTPILDFPTDISTTVSYSRHLVLNADAPTKATGKIRCVLTGSSTGIVLTSDYASFTLDTSSYG